MNQVLPPYSVLMAVYAKEKPEYFRCSIESILNQTCRTDDFVLVCDGPLTAELNRVIDAFSGDLHVVRLEKSCGLALALREGLKHCTHELIARMDSDDISLPNRCEYQLQCFQSDQDLDIVSGTLMEFTYNATNVTGKRALPCKHEEIVEFSKRRCPFNHPCVMYKKHAVLAAGGYRDDYTKMEDYYLWIRMLQSGARARNLPDTLLMMRVSPALYRRRGGWTYANSMLKFHWWVYRSGWSRLTDFLGGAIGHWIVCVLPNGIRSVIYKVLHSGYACKSPGNL